MRFLAHLAPAEHALVTAALAPVNYPAGTRIVEQGAPGDGCWFIDSGTVRLELDIGEVDSDGVLGYLDPGAVLGEFSLLDKAPRSADAWAHTDVTARFLSASDFDRITTEYPRIGVSILGTMAAELAQKLRSMNERVAVHIPAEGLVDGVDTMVAEARAAQRVLATWPEARVDALITAIAHAIHDEAPTLADMSVRETGLGVAAHRLGKIRIGTLETLASILGRPGAGTITWSPERRLLEVASPVGVVFGLVPLTNPVSTFAFKTLICLKSRNAVILSCHRNALGVGNAVGAIIERVLAQHGAPLGLVQWVRDRGSRRKTAMFMAHPGVALILATGGPGMVKAAYSSGTPAIGVGAGNAPVYVAADADLDKTAAIVVGSKSFDCGVICGSENNLVAHAAIAEAFRTALENAGAIVLNSDEKATFLARAFPGGHLARGAIGKTAPVLLAGAGIDRIPDAHLIVVPASPKDPAELHGPLGHEKLAPILSLFTVDDDAHAFSVCHAILTQEGAGHTAVIHTHDEALARRFGEEMPVSRVLVSQGATLGCIGHGNALSPSLTLGCGTWGGGSTTDNVTMDHLRNIRRVAWPLET
jgi:acyl-CoA reductase-like NAD-dependent aldehyde dehydrogenase